MGRTRLSCGGGMVRYATIGAAVALGLVMPGAMARESPPAEYKALVAKHAKANGIPESLVHRVIMRESRYQPHLVGRCGCYGMMQIKPATARSMGYSGDASGLLDADTNMTYAVRYLAGAYRAAGGDHDRAVALYA